MVYSVIDDFNGTLYEEGAFAKPTNLTADNVTFTSADLSWTAGADETKWQVVYSTEANFDKNAATPVLVETPSYSLTGLQDNTTYYAAVRAYISETEQSNWANISFTTPMAPISQFPYTENFNGITSGIPTGWDNAEGTTTTDSYKWNYYATGHDGACVRFNSYNNSNGITNMLKTPVMTFPAGETMKLNFWYKNPKGGDFSVYISNDGGATYETALVTGLTGATDWTEQTINIPEGFTENVVIVFKGTSNWGSGDAYIYLDDVEVAITTNNPATMDVTFEDADVPATVAFGNVGKATTKTFTVSNTGDQTLNATIAVSGDNVADFTLSANSIEVAGGKSATFTVTFASTDYDVEKTATVTLSAEGLENVAFNVSGTFIDVWMENFEAGVMPEGWEANGIVVKTGSVGGYPTYTLDSYVAVGNGGPGEKTLITPLLSATEGETLSFDGFFYYGDETFKVDYSTDLNTWNNLYTYDKTSYDNGSTNNIEIQSPITGKFYLRFVVNYYNGVDNIVGFHLAKAEEHEAIIAAQTIPATGTQYVEYTATADVKVIGTNDEELTVKFFIGDTQYGEDVTKTVASGETETFTVTFTTEEPVSGDAYFTVSNADINLESAKTAVDIAAAPVISETAEENPFEAKTYEVMVLDYKAKKGWNTIALPFTLNDLSVFGTDVKAFEFDSFTDGVLSFKKVEKISNQTPALLYVGGEPASESIILKNVNVMSASADLCGTTKGEATFQGVYAKTAAGDLTDKYGVSTQGVIGMISANGTLKAMRAYFDITVAGSTRLSLSIDGGMSTNIDGIFAEGQNENVYNLQGQKVMNAQKGLYIVNGKKVVKK